MSDMPATKADVLRAIETECVWWRTVIDLAEQNGPLTGDEPITGYWTLRELVGHVNGWRRWSVARLEAAAHSDIAPVAPWPQGMAEDSDAATDEINAWFQEQSRSASFESTIGEVFSLLDRMRAAVEAIPETSLLTPGFFSKLDPELADYPIGPAIVGWSILHVHQEHGPELQEWLTERIGQHAELPPTPSYFGYE